MKVDILVIAAHPDDAELACSGTIAKHIEMGYKVAILDLTQGELGTRGTVETRVQEAAQASKILRLTHRSNAKLRDGFFESEESQIKTIISYIRFYQPDIVIGNAPEDRHPDHGRAGAMIERAVFLSGLVKIETSFNEVQQTPWRPQHFFQYIQDRLLTPHFIIDITPYWEIKLQSIQAYNTQFYNPNSTEPNTYISRPEFMQYIEARSIEMGHAIGVKYGEGFITKKIIQVNSLFDLK
jgi:bacillithiol biosynthesis deacetylase BshB1